jgi:hypothetical protein
MMCASSSGRVALICTAHTVAKLVRVAGASYRPLTSPIPELSGRAPSVGSVRRRHSWFMDEPNVIGPSRPHDGEVALAANVVLFYRLRRVRQEAPAAELREHRGRGGLGAVRKILGNGE